MEDNTKISDKDFHLFSDLIYEKSGINIQPHKRSLIENRLGREIRRGRFASFKEYYEFVTADASGNEIVALLDAVSTNVTHFFRENKHFDFFREKVIPEWLATNGGAGEKLMRIWSAASSSGEEPYSIAITAEEAMPSRSGASYKVLGTDISTRVLEQAVRGVYREDKVNTVPRPLLMRYFTKSGENGSTQFSVSEHLKKKVSFQRFNLISESYPFRNPMDVIFCRNVMIYFDKPTQQAIVEKFHRLLKTGGYLFLGHSEGLTGVKHDFRYVMPSVYRKEAVC